MDGAEGFQQNREKSKETIYWIRVGPVGPRFPPECEAGRGGPRAGENPPGGGAARSRSAAEITLPPGVVTAE